MLGWFRRILRLEDPKIRKWREWDKLPRPEYLRVITVDRRDSLAALIPTQIEKSQIDLVLQNLTIVSGLFRSYFELAILAWARGDSQDAVTNFAQALAVRRRAVAIAHEHGREGVFQNPQIDAVIAAYLLDEDRPALDVSDLDRAYEPQLKMFLLHSALDVGYFDQTRWESLQATWLGRGHPKYMLGSLQFYVDVLTGVFSTGDDILQRHAKLWTARSKRNPDLSLYSGYGQDNIYVVDDLFAVILKRIGWDGAYHHAWPVAQEPDAQRTDREPDAFLSVRSSQVIDKTPSLSVDEAVETYRKKATANPDYYGIREVDRKPADHPKVTCALTSLGLNNPILTDIAQRYRLSELVSDHTHFSLCDPIDNDVPTLKESTALYAQDFGLHPDFVMLISSLERADYMAPDGGFAVMDRNRGEVLIADRDEWHDADRVRANAKDGITRWEDYGAFLAFWLRD